MYRLICIIFYAWMLMNKSSSIYQVCLLNSVILAICLYSQNCTLSSMSNTKQQIFYLISMKISILLNSLDRMCSTEETYTFENYILLQHYLIFKYYLSITSYRGCCPWHSKVTGQTTQEALGVKPRSRVKLQVYPD